MIVHCKSCGRKLTTPKSIKRGFGPVCYKKIPDALRASIEHAMLYEPIIQDEEWEISDNRERD